MGEFTPSEARWYNWVEMIREQIKKDLKEVIEDSGILKGDFLNNIEWLLETVNKENFEDFPDPIPVGKLRPEVQKAIGAKDDLVYLKPRVYAKIRGWWKVYPGHPEITLARFFLIPFAVLAPQRIFPDKERVGTYHFVSQFGKALTVVVAVSWEGGVNEINTIFLLREGYLKDEGEIRVPGGGPAVSPSWSHLAASAGSRISTLHQEFGAHYSRLKEKCQVDFLGYRGVTAEDIHLEHPANPEHGDYSSNIALTLKSQISKLKSQSQNSNLKTVTPKDLAELIIKHFPKVDYLKKVEVAPPGFINFYLKKEWLQSQVGKILEQSGDYGLTSKFKVQNSKLKVQVEFISANPTGPLHIGNARGGFCGDVLANVLAKVGYKVQREYYINDKGVQVDKLAESVKAVVGGAAVPEGGYVGDYVEKIAQEAREQRLEGLDNLKSFAIYEVLENIKKTVARMGIKFDQFFSEQSLYDNTSTTFKVEKTLQLLDDKGLTYKKEGATWFRSSGFGDEKDRVLIKSDGEMTYLVSDVAYHLDKFEKRKFDKVILFWGADHHGYVPRFLAMIEAIGHQGKAQVELIQLLKLSRGGKAVRMSKRAGEYVTVDDVLDEIGLDAARFHFLAVPLNTPMTLDLEKAKEQSQKNPVYYVQYACARMQSILAKFQISNYKSQINSKFKIQNFKTNEELALIRKLVQLSEVVVDISENHEVHRLPQYATEVADAFHRFYENCRVLSDDEELTAARLGLVKATQIVLTETLGLMGISAPERM